MSAIQEQSSIADRPITTRQRRSRVGFRADSNRTGSTGATRRAFNPTRLPGGVDCGMTAFNARNIESRHIEGEH